MKQEHNQQIDVDYLDYAVSYNNSLAVSNSAALMSDLVARSHQVYQRHQVKKDIRYGQSERQRLDWFTTDKDAKGTLIFIHGGYWQHCSKEDFAFIVSPLLDRGFDVILLEYTLAPECSLTQITQQIGEGLDFIRDELPVHQPVYLSGHSAGGHLTAYWQQHSLIGKSLAISGLFELAPLQKTALNENLQLTNDELAQLSPLRRIDTLQPSDAQSLVILYGANELPELVNQSIVYYKTLEQMKYNVQCIGVTGADHFTVLEHIFSANGDVIKILTQ